MTATQMKNCKIGVLITISGIVGFVLDAFLVSKLMVIQGGAAIIIVGFILSILLFLLSLILTVSGIAMLREYRKTKHSKNLATKPVNVKPKIEDKKKAITKKSAMKKPLAKNPVVKVAAKKKPAAKKPVKKISAKKAGTKGKKA